jgi:hypothetical protein
MQSIQREVNSAEETAFGLICAYGNVMSSLEIPQDMLDATIPLNDPEESCAFPQHQLSAQPAALYRTFITDTQPTFQYETGYVSGAFGNAAAPYFASTWTSQSQSHSPSGR